MEVENVGLEYLPDFMRTAIKSMPLGDMAAIADTNKTWNDWVKNNLNLISLEYELPYGKSIQEIIDYSWWSSNALLKKACNEGDGRMVKIALKKDACRISKYGYFAAKHGHVEIVDILLAEDADWYVFVKGACRGDQLSMLFHLGVDEKRIRDDYNLRKLMKYAYTTEKSKIRDWLEEHNLYREEFNQSELLSQEDQKNLKLPNHMIAYSKYVLNPRLFWLVNNEPINFNHRYIFLLYILVKFNYPALESYLSVFSALSFHKKTLKYCIRHDKYVDLMLRFYDDKKKAISRIALKHHRFDILEKYPIKFYSGEEIMKYAVKSPRIFNYLSEKLGRLPLTSGLIRALFDKPKMLKYIYEKMGSQPELFIYILKWK